MSGTWRAFQSALPYSSGSFSISKVATLQAPNEAIFVEEVSPLSGPELAQLLPAAIQLWEQRGLDEQSLQRLRETRVEVAGLPGPLLGATSQDVIRIDSTAAGFGWFIDATPDRNEEFTLHNSVYRAPVGSDAGRMDLLTVLTHEMGHLLGFRDLDSDLHADDIMSDTLSPGMRRLPWAKAVDRVFAEGF